MSDLKVSVTLDAPQVNIQKLHDKVQDYFNKTPVKISLQFDDKLILKASDSIAHQVQTLFDGVLKNYDFSKGAEGLYKELESLSEAFGKKLNIGEKFDLEIKAREIAAKRFSEQLQAQMQEVQNQKEAFHKTNMTGIDLEIKAQDERSRRFSAQLKEQMELAVQEEKLWEKLQVEQQKVRAKYGGDYFKNMYRRINQIGGSPKDAEIAIQNVQALKAAVQNFDRAVSQRDPSAVNWLNELNLSAKNTTASITSLNKTAQVINTELSRKATADRAITSLERFFNMNETKIRKNSVLMKQYLEIQDRIKAGYYGDLEVNENLNKLQRDIASFQKTAVEAGVEVQTLGDRIKKLFGAHLGTVAIMAALNALRKTIMQTWQNVKDLDKAIVDLGIASGLNRSQVKELVKDYSELARQIGATTIEVANSADSWLRQGYSIEESNKLIRDTMMLSKLGQMESAEAATALTSAMKGYQMSVDDATNIVSKFVAVDMDAAVTAGGLATALSETAVSAKVAGVEMDRIIGYIAKVMEVTQDAPESVGNFFKTIFARMGQIKEGRLIDPETGESLSNVETVLGSLGIKLRNSEKDWRSFQDVLDDVAARWDEYSDTQRRAIANAFGMTRQQEKFLVLMENYGDALKLADVAANSAGLATEKYGTYMDGLEAHLNSLTAAFESLSSTILNSDAIKVFIDGLTSAVTVIEKVISTLGTLPTLIGTIGVGFAAFGKGIVGENGKLYAPYTRVAA